MLSRPKTMARTMATRPGPRARIDPTAATARVGFPGAGQRRARDMNQPAIPGKQGLYDPQYEHDACGVGLVVDLKGCKSHTLLEQAIQVLLNLEHRGACGCEKNTGDGAGILLQTPHRFLARECDKLGIKLPAPDEYGVG